jgi:hypothetical protein
MDANIGVAPAPFDDWIAGGGARGETDATLQGVAYLRYLQTLPYYGPGPAITDEMRASISADLDKLQGPQPLTELERAQVLSLPASAWTTTKTQRILSWALNGMVNSSFDPINQPDSGNPRDTWAGFLSQVVTNHYGLPGGPDLDALFQPVSNLSGTLVAMAIFGAGAIGAIAGISVGANVGGAAAAATSTEAVDGIGGAIVAGTGGAATGAAAAAGGAVDTAVGAVAGSVGSAAASSGAAAAGAAGAAGSAIADTLASVVSTVKDVLSPIADTIHSISGFVNDINTGLIQPIVGPITSILDNYKALSSSLTTDLHSGVAGLLKIPSDIAGAVSSIDATMQRAITQLGAMNEDVIKRQLGPGVAQGMGSAFDAVGVALNGGLDKSVADEKDLSLSRINEDPTLEDVAAMVDRITSWMSEGSGWLGQLAGKIVDGLASATLVFSWLEAKQHFYRQEGNVRFPTTLLDVGVLTEAYRRGIVEPTLFFDQLRRLGYAPERVQVLDELSRTLPGTQDAIAWRARDLIDDDQVMNLLKMNGWREDDANRYIVAAKVLPDLQTAIAWYRRGLLGETEVRGIIAAANYRPEDVDRILAGSQQLVALEDGIRYFDRVVNAQPGMGESAVKGAVPDELVASLSHLGLTFSTLNTIWSNHWQLLQPQLAVSAYFRGYINLPQLKGALSAAAIPDELHSLYIDLQRPLPSLRNIPAMLKAGILNGAEAQDRLQQLGYSLVDADHIIQLALHKTAPAGTANGDELHGVTTGVVSQLYDAGTLDAAQAMGLYTRLGMGAEAQQLTIALHDLRRDAADRKAHAELIIAQAKAGHIEFADAQAQLHAANLTSTEVERYLAQLERATQARTKLPSEAQVMQLLKHDIIDRATAAATLGLIGYGAVWTERLLTLEEGKASAPTTTG